MAITFVGSASASAINGGNANVTLPAGMQQNDLVLLGCCNGGSTPSLPTGYTNLQAAFSANLGYRACRKFMGASPDTTVIAGGSGSATDATAGVVLVFRGVDLTTPLDVTFAFDSNVSGAPDAPSITPTSADCAIAIFGMSATNDTTPGTVTNYTNPTPFTATGNDNNPVTAAGAYRLLSGGAGVAQDPAAWSSWTSGAWRAFTIALRPSTGTPWDGAATFGGAGALSSDTTANVVGQASLLGSGALSAGTLQQMQASAIFVGAGALSVSATLNMVMAATFSGQGILRASATVPGQVTEWQGAATFIGAGALSAYASSNMLAAATYQGSGVLSVDLTKPGRSLAATFGGTGLLSASAFRDLGGFATFSGAGNLTATARQSNQASALYSGAGALSAAAIQRLIASARFAGSGQLSGLLEPFSMQYQGQGRFGGRGELRADAFVIKGEMQLAYDYPIGHGLYSDYGIRASITGYKRRLIIGRR